MLQKRMQGIKFKSLLFALSFVGGHSPTIGFTQPMDKMDMLGTYLNSRKKIRRSGDPNMRTFKLHGMPSENYLFQGSFGLI